MLFSGDNYSKVLDGRKTQTRRPAGDREDLLTDACHGVTGVWRFEEEPYGRMRLRWAIDKTYAVQPGRGIAAGGRIRIAAIRRQRLQDISWEDAIAEGIEEQDAWGHAVDIFAILWDDIYGKRTELRWEANPGVWVIEFHAIKMNQGVQA